MSTHKMSKKIRRIAMKNMRKHISSKKQYCNKDSQVVPKQNSSIVSLLDGGPYPGRSLAHITFY